MIDMVMINQFNNRMDNLEVDLMKILIQKIYSICSLVEWHQIYSSMDKESIEIEDNHNKEHIIRILILLIIVSFNIYHYSLFYSPYSLIYSHLY